MLIFFRQLKLSKHKHNYGDKPLFSIRFLTKNWFMLLLTEFCCLPFPGPPLKYGKLRACIKGWGKESIFTTLY